MRITRKQSLVLSGCVVAAFFLVAGILQYNQQKHNVLQTSTEGDQTTSPVKDLEITMGPFKHAETKDGKKLWEITSDEGRYSPSEHKANLKNSKLWFYKNDGDVITVNANRADVTIENNKIGNVKLAGDIILTLNDLKLTTRRASMQGSDQKLTIPGMLTLEKPGMFLQGRILHADLEKREFVLKADVVTKFSRTEKNVSIDNTFKKLSTNSKKTTGRKVKNQHKNKKQTVRREK